MIGEQAARAALDAHDALSAANTQEPALDSEGRPRFPTDWIAWYENDYKPAYAAWLEAMDALDAALGEHVSRHPHNFRPLCEELLA